VKRRSLEQVKSAETLDQKVLVVCLTGQLSVRVLPGSTRRIAGSYRLREQVHAELGNAVAASPSNGTQACQRAAQRAEAA